MQEINTFRQLKGGNLAEAWEIFHELLRKCPHHRLTIWMQVHTFYNCLRDATKIVIDASTGGTLMKKTTDKEYEILEDTATNSNQWPGDRITPIKVVGGADNKVLNNPVTHVAQLTKQQGTVNVVQTSPWELCEFCRGQHNSTKCHLEQQTVEHTQYVSRFNQPQQQGQYGSNNYHNQNQGKGWHNN